MKWKRWINHLLFGSMVLMMSEGCAQDENFDKMFKRLTSGDVPVVYPEHLDSAKALLLDARERNEFEVSHLKAARFVGYDDFDIEALSDVPKDTPIVVYCSVGYRSEKVGKKLQDAGFTNVSNLYGGIFHWVNTGNTVVSDSGETQKVHAFNQKWGKWLEKGEKVYE